MTEKKKDIAKPSDSGQFISMSSSIKSLQPKNEENSLRSKTNDKNVGNGHALRACAFVLLWDMGRDQ